MPPELAANDLVPTVRLESIPRGKYVRYDDEALDILICNTPQGVFAVENRCSHQLLPLERGRLNGTSLTCPVHGGMFDVKNGCPLRFPAGRPIRAFACTVIDGVVWVDPVPVAIGENRA